MAGLPSCIHHRNSAFVKSHTHLTTKLKSQGNLMKLLIIIERKYIHTYLDFPLFFHNFRRTNFHVKLQNKLWLWHLMLDEFSHSRSCWEIWRWTEISKFRIRNRPVERTGNSFYRWLCSSIVKWTCWIGIAANLNV